jgi:hypothetical protein
MKTLLLSGLLLLCMLGLQGTASADSCGVGVADGGATAGPYTLTFCLHPSLVIENGPLGAETFQIVNNLVFWNANVAMNDSGQWALVTDGGTADWGTLWGQYAGPITVPPISIPNGSHGGISPGIPPGGTLVGDDGNLGYNVTQAPGFGSQNNLDLPIITGVTDKGLVSATVLYGILDQSTQEISTGSVDYTWNFPNLVPEPGTLPLIIGSLLVAVAFGLRAHGTPSKQ